MEAIVVDSTATQDERLEAFWRQYAASYDRILPLAPFYQVAVGRHISALAAHGARRVLDLGCGTGNVAVPIAFAGADVVALDSSRAMLDLAAAKAAGCGVVDRIRFIEQDAHQMAFDEPFDAVNCLLALFCMTDARCVLTTAVNSLRPGGLIVFTEPTRAFREESLLVYAQQVIFQQLRREELARDWDVVSNAGHTLGSLIRNVKDANVVQHKIRADDLPGELSQLGCHVMATQDSHLGECRYIVACKLTS